MSDRKINFNYFNRDYDSLKSDLISFVRLNYPDQYNDFSEPNVAMMLLELNAYVGDILSFHVDQKFNELFLDSAQNRNSVIRLAKNLGYKPRGKRPAVTMLDVSIEIPTEGDGYNSDYLITIGEGMRVSSTSGQKYEVIEDIDFNVQTSLGGVNNRTIEPIYNSQHEIVKYKVTKRIAAMAGESKIATLEITSANAIPYLKWKINEGDYNITEIRNMISKDDRYAPTVEADWAEGGSYNVWYEVDSLPEERVFVDTSVSGGAEGYWKYTERRFIKEYDENGDCFLTFGAGYNDYNNYNDYITNGLSGMNLASILNNDSLGRIPSVGTYLHCRYRTGAGKETNASQGTITKVSSYEITYVPGGSVPSGILAEVVGSIRVTNPIPAVGGRDFETIEEIKHIASKYFSSQDRCVTSEDYVGRISKLPLNYGTIFRSYAEPDVVSKNTKIYVLGLDENNKLKNTGNEQLKYNLASYLKNYRILNDVVTIHDGTIINVGIRFSVQCTMNDNKKTVIANCINELKNYFAIEKWQMNDTIYISQVVELLRKQPGVVNVGGIRFYNLVGGDYSNDVYSREGMSNAQIISKINIGDGYIEMLPINNKLTAPKSGMFEIKYPERDIRGAVIT